MLSATQLRVGTVIKFEGELYRVTYIMHRTPGNKRGFVQTKLRNLSNNKVIEYRFASDDKVENPALEYRELQYLYAENDQSEFHFMDNKSYDQIAIQRDILEEAIPYLQENMNFIISFNEHTPVAIQLPEKMEFKIVETEPELRGATVTSSFKPATLSNGLVVQVPSFVKEGDVIRINTEHGEYLERV